MYGFVYSTEIFSVRKNESSIKDLFHGPRSFEYTKQTTFAEVVTFLLLLKETNNIKIERTHAANVYKLILHLSFCRYYTYSVFPFTDLRYYDMN